MSKVIVTTKDQFVKPTAEDLKNPAWLKADLEKMRSAYRKARYKTERAIYMNDREFNRLRVALNLQWADTITISTNFIYDDYQKIEEDEKKNQVRLYIHHYPSEDAGFTQRSIFLRHDFLIYKPYNMEYAIDLINDLKTNWLFEYKEEAYYAAKREAFQKAKTIKKIERQKNKKPTIGALKVREDGSLI